MPFNQQHLLNGIAFAHGLNEKEKKDAKPDINAMHPKDHAELAKLHRQLLSHHLKQMELHAKAVHTLTGGKG